MNPSSTSEGRYLLLAAFMATLAFTSCHTDTHPGEAVARRYCGSCHAFPDPALLPKKSWEQSVLPAMGKLMGLQFFNGVPYQDIYSDEIRSNIHVSDWQRIVEYYRSQAPEVLPSRQRQPVPNETRQFSFEAPAPVKEPSTVYIKMDPGNQRIYASFTADSSLYTYNRDLRLLQKHRVGSTVIDMWFAEPLSRPGSRSGIFTDVGILHPNEGKTGSAYGFFRDTDGVLKLQQKIADSLPRPVQVIPADLDRDGLQDYLVCGFGNHTGEFFWQRNTGTGFIKKPLRQQPGAVKAYVEDFNNDGEPDIMVLFAQGSEGIFLYTNQGNGNFKETMLLQFPPVYGSSYFELHDMTGDGKKDIIYTCGDNADFTANVKALSWGLPV